ncbi:ATP-binding protein [Salibacteraceae bacterium]|nr:ATP-binding protein [Salibacteraceae bacterium]
MLIKAQSLGAKTDAYESLLINAQSSLNHPDSSLAILHKTKADSGNDSLNAEYYRIKGSAFFYKGIIDSAISYFSSAMALVDSSECDQQYSKVANGLAVVLQSAGMRRNAIDYYSKSLGCAEFRNDRNLKLKIFSNLSILNNELKDYESSQYYIDKSLEIINPEDNKMLATLLNTKSQNFIAQTMYDSASYYAELSLSKRPINDLKGRAVNLNNLGYIYGLKGDNARSREYFEQSARIRKEIEDLFGLASIFINLADLSIGEMKLDEASHLIQNAQILSSKVHSHQIELRLYSSLSKLKEAEGNAEQALKYLKKSQAINDSLMRDDQLKNLQYAQYGVTLSEAQNKVKRIQKEEELRNETIDRQRLINLLLGVGIAIVIGLLSLLIYQLKMLMNLRKELTQERDEAKSNAEFRRETLNSVVHELRTPMNAVISLADILQIETDPEEVKKLTKLLSKSSARLLSTTNNILTYSRIEQGSVEVVLRPIDLSELVTDLCALLELKAKSKNFELTRVIPENIIAKVDKSILEILLMNLIGNAIKFTKIGGVDVSIKESDDYIEISVSDTGSGISDEDIENLFEPFFQGSADQNNTSQEGTGLGLSICKHYADLMGAKIRVRSELKVGSVFTLFIKKIA